METSELPNESYLSDPKSFHKENVAMLPKYALELRKLQLDQY